MPSSPTSSHCPTRSRRARCGIGCATRLWALRASAAASMSRGRSTRRRRRAWTWSRAASASCAPATTARGRAGRRRSNASPRPPAEDGLTGGLARPSRRSRDGRRVRRRRRGERRPNDVVPARRPVRSSVRSARPGLSSVRVSNASRTAGGGPTSGSEIARDKRGVPVDAGRRGARAASAPPQSRTTGRPRSSRICGSRRCYSQQKRELPLLSSPRHELLPDNCLSGQGGNRTPDTGIFRPRLRALYSVRAVCAGVYAVRSGARGGLGSLHQSLYPGSAREDALPAGCRGPSSSHRMAGATGHGIRPRALRLRSPLDRFGRPRRRAVPDPYPRTSGAIRGDPGSP